MIDILYYNHERELERIECVPYYSTAVSKLYAAGYLDLTHDTFRHLTTHTVAELFIRKED